MLDLAAGIEARNYGLGRSNGWRTVLESAPIILPLLGIMSVLSFHIWVRSQSIHIGYQSQQLSTQEEDLLQIQRQLILEEQTLKNPAWLEATARKNLGMILLKPNQIISPPIENWDTGSPRTFKLGSLLEPSEPKKQPLFN